MRASGSGRRAGRRAGSARVAMGSEWVATPAGAPSPPAERGAVLTTGPPTSNVCVHGMRRSQPLMRRAMLAGQPQPWRCQWPPAGAGPVEGLRWCCCITGESPGRRCSGVGGRRGRTDNRLLCSHEIYTRAAISAAVLGMNAQYEVVGTMSILPTKLATSREWRSSREGRTNKIGGKLDANSTVHILISGEGNRKAACKLQRSAGSA